MSTLLHQIMSSSNNNNNNKKRRVIDNSTTEPSNKKRRLNEAKKEIWECISCEDFNDGDIDECLTCKNPRYNEDDDIPTCTFCNRKRQIFDDYKCGGNKCTNTICKWCSINEKFIKASQCIVCNGWYCTTHTSIQMLEKYTCGDGLYCAKGIICIQCIQKKNGYTTELYRSVITEKMEEVYYCNKCNKCE